MTLKDILKDTRISSRSIADRLGWHESRLNHRIAGREPLSEAMKADVIEAIRAEYAEKRENFEKNIEIFLSENQAVTK